MLSYGNIIGKMDDWANVITNVEMRDTPFLAWLPLGDDINQAVHIYQAEKYADPVENSHVDGKPVTGFEAAGKDRGLLKSVFQYSTKTAASTTLHQLFGNIAGIPNGTGNQGGDLGKEITKKSKELSTDIEAASLSAQEAREDNQNVGFKTRGMPNWVQTGAQSLYPVPADFRPPSASVDTTATASLTENVVLNILGGMWGKTKSKENVTCWVGNLGKQGFNNMPLFIPGSVLTTSGTTSPYMQRTMRGILDRTIERYNTDYGPVTLEMSAWNHALDSTATYKTHSAYFLHQRMWNFSWGMKPTWRMKEYQGGAYESFTECVWRLECLNPLGEGAWKPAT